MGNMGYFTYSFQEKEEHKKKHMQIIHRRDHLHGTGA
jgi:hypothetical protein